MRKLFSVCALSSAVAILGAIANVPRAMAATYFSFSDSDGLMGELPVDGFLKETREGGKVVSAILDICHSVSKDSDRKDRFVVTLRPQAGKLVGSGVSQEYKLPVSVSVTRKQTASSVTFEGTITRGSTTFDWNSPDQAGQNEKEFKQSLPEPDQIEVAPKDFTEVSPGSVALKVKRAFLVDIIKELRTQAVQLSFTSLAAGCDTLRSGEYVLDLDVDPERAPELIAKLKSQPGVSKVGWGIGSYSMDRAVLFPVATWMGTNGKIDKSKITQFVSISIANSLSAKLKSSEWDNNTGELTLKFARSDSSVPGLELVQDLDISMLIGPDKRESADNLILWLGDFNAETVDRGAGPRLTFYGADVGGGGGEDNSQFKDNDAPIAALAEALKGKTSNQITPTGNRHYSAWAPPILRAYKADRA